MTSPTLTDCVAYISAKIAHAIKSGVNHREKVAAGAPSKAYKCTLRRDYCEAIVQHLQAGHAMHSALDEARAAENAASALHGKVGELLTACEQAAADIGHRPIKDIIAELGPAWSAFDDLRIAGHKGN